VYRSFLECYGASSIIAKVEVCLETAPDEEDLHVMSVVRIWQRGRARRQGQHTAYTITAENTVAATAFPSGGSSVEPIIEW
jgi:hypothetical protein